MPVIISGATSGATTVQATDAVTATITLPSATGTLISTSSTGQSIPKAALPTGSVLQVVNAVYSTITTSSSQTFIDTGLTATITPTSATSKILVLISHPTNSKNTGSAANDLGLQLVRNSTSISIFGISLGYNNSNTPAYFSASHTHLDSPATTSATTYKTQFKNHDFNGASATVQADSTPSTITLMEIAA
jgi:hypothetical protein